MRKLHSIWVCTLHLWICRGQVWNERPIWDLDERLTEVSQPECLVVQIAGLSMTHENQDLAWNMPDVAGQHNCSVLSIVPNSPYLGYGEDATSRIAEQILKLQDDHSIDTANTVITGYSAGGFQVWNLWIEYPHLFDFGVVVAASCSHPSCQSTVGDRRPDIWYIYGKYDNVVSGLAETQAIMRRKSGFFFETTVHEQTSAKIDGSFLGNALQRSIDIRRWDLVSNAKSILGALHLLTKVQAIGIPTFLLGIGGHCIPDSYSSTLPKWDERVGGCQATNAHTLLSEQVFQKWRNKKIRVESHTSIL